MESEFDGPFDSALLFDTARWQRLPMQSGDFGAVLRYFPRIFNVYGVKASVMSSLPRKSGAVHSSLYIGDSSFARLMFTNAAKSHDVVGLAFAGKADELRLAIRQRIMTLYEVHGAWKIGAEANGSISLMRKSGSPGPSLRSDSQLSLVFNRGQTYLRSTLRATRKPELSMQAVSRFTNRLSAGVKLTLLGPALAKATGTADLALRMVDAFVEHRFDHASLTLYSDGANRRLRILGALWPSPGHAVFVSVFAGLHRSELGLAIGESRRLKDGDELHWRLSLEKLAVAMRFVQSPTLRATASVAKVWGQPGLRAGVFLELRE
eukprot:c39474_g1_i1.p1 GENE.c39474_g1_i1~~c39474_g1_i1.p1  ORF type:complete len:350 (+),score=45.30 c39474_g1_i1:90-1052(+)